MIAGRAGWVNWRPSGAGAHRAAVGWHELGPPETAHPLRRYSALNWKPLAVVYPPFLADQVVYQSQFARQWWQTVYGGVRAPGRVIYNGVDLRAFSPDGPHDRPVDHIRLLLVEGNLAGGNEQGLINAVRLADALGRQVDQKVELVVAGNVPAEMRAEIERDYAGGLWVRWAGVLAREDIPHLDRSAHLMFSADLNAACPNSVIEALACGLPVLGYATGSLPELIDEDAGRGRALRRRTTEFGAPEIEPLVAAAIEVINEQDCFRQAARRRAELVFSIERVVDQYLTSCWDKPAVNYGVSAFEGGPGSLGDAHQAVGNFTTMRSRPLSTRPCASHWLSTRLTV